MPTYDYRCEANDRVVEVQHGMNEKLSTWGELCARAGVDCGDTPPDAPVVRLITGGHVVSATGSGPDVAAPCATGTCGGGFCGLG